MHLIAALTLLAILTSGLVVFTNHDDERRADRVRIVALALGVRLLVFAGISVFVWLTGSREIFPDEYGFSVRATHLMESGTAAEVSYSNFLGTIFEVTGPSMWLPRLMNVLAGAATAVLVYELGSLLAGKRIARIAAVAVSLWPSLVLWSALVLKDSLVIFAIVAILWGATLALENKWHALITVAACSVLLAQLRGFAFVTISFAALLGIVVWVVRHRRRPRLAAVALVVVLGLGGVAGVLGPFGKTLIQGSLVVDEVSRWRREGGTGTTGFASPDAQDISDVVGGIPTGVFFSLFGPFPWDAGPLAARAALVVELPLWYAAMVAAVLGLFRTGIRRLFERWTMVVSFLLGTLLIFGIYSANAGTVFRQRSMIIPIVLLLASVTVARRIDPGDASAQEGISSAGATRSPG